MLCDGETLVFPEVAPPPIVKLSPEQLVALIEDQESVAELPWMTLVGFTDMLQAGPTAQDWLVYEPLKEPFEHERLSETHEEPYGTVLAWYAVTDEP